MAAVIQIPVWNQEISPVTLQGNTPFARLMLEERLYTSYYDLHVEANEELLATVKRPSLVELKEFVSQILEENLEEGYDSIPELIDLFGRLAFAIPEPQKQLLHSMAFNATEHSEHKDPSYTREEIIKLLREDLTRFSYKSDTGAAEL